MKFIFESESTINSYEPDYTIDYDRDIEDTEIDFEEVENVHAVALDLLSLKGLSRLPKDIRRYSDWWWLRSPGRFQSSATSVIYNGQVNYYGNYVNYDNICVRPVLTLSDVDSSNFKLYIGYIIGDSYWDYIGNNKFLYNDKPVKHRFDKESTDYKSSDVKRFLNDWLKKLQNKDLTVEEA